MASSTVFSNERGNSIVDTLDSLTRRGFLQLAAGGGAMMLTAQAIAAENPAIASPAMLWGDTSRYGHPYAKDPSVIRLGDRYLLYCSLPPYGDKRPNDGWRIGIAESRDLISWNKIAELVPENDAEKKGICAPDAMLLDGKVHLFYQTYGNGPKDAICLAISENGVDFVRHPENPIFHPTGEWSVGRAIDANAIEHEGRVFLYFATRDPAMKVQMIGAAAAPRDSNFGRQAWTPLGNGPVFKPELAWEKQCIEAPSVCKRDGVFYLFYAGAYNNEPQQIGVASSVDGITWKRLSDEPLLCNGKSGEWNSSESGHPGFFLDRDGQSYLFYQGNADHGKSWLLSWKKLRWEDGRPHIAD
jgi:beta-xylosidase